MSILTFCYMPVDTKFGILLIISLFDLIILYLTDFILFYLVLYFCLDFRGKARPGGWRTGEKTFFLRAAN